MKSYFWVLTGFIIVVIFSCKKDDTFLQGEFSIYEIKNHTEYINRIVLENYDDINVLLNGSPIEFRQGIYEIKEAGFYEMIIGASDTVEFVLLDEERGETEWGLKKWFSVLPDFNKHYAGTIDFLYPAYNVPGVEIPFLIQAGTRSVLSTVNLECRAGDGSVFYVKRGLGVSSQKIYNDDHLIVDVAGTQHNLDLKHYENDAIVLPEVLPSDFEIAPNSLVKIEKDLEIPSDITLTISSGSTVLVNPSVNIYVNGGVKLMGKKEAPVLITCAESDKNFGGFIVEESQLGVYAEYSFFTRFGFHNEENYQYGHAKRQALFKMDNVKASFNYCYFFDSPGQAFFPEYSELEFDQCVFFSLKTAGEIVGGVIKIRNSYFSDFPNANSEYLNEDNDGLYINGADAYLSNSIFMYAKDDGIDSGAGGGGQIVVDSCLFEACFHEGMALSSIEPAQKTHVINRCYFIGCQQGVELGYSSSNHSVTINQCRFEKNHIGIRYGDNYKNDVSGAMNVSNSMFSNNDKDHWNMVRKHWAPNSQNFIIR